MEKANKAFFFKLIIVGFFISIITALFVIKLIFSLSTITMPDFTGISFENAQKICSKLALELKVEDEIYSNIYEKGIVISQNLKPKSKIKKGRVVYVILSKGSKLVTTPDITNTLKSKAIIEIKNNDLDEGYESVIFSPIYKENFIIAQYPPPGVQIQFKSRINFLKSAGEKKQSFLMPDFLNQNIFSVYKILSSKKIFLNKLIIEDNENFNTGTIINQEPPYGHKINSDTQIILTATKKPSDTFLKKRLIKIVYTLTESNVARLIKINVFSLSGNETIFNDVIEPQKTISLNTNVIGDAYVQIFMGNELLKELEYKLK